MNSDTLLHQFLQNLKPGQFIEHLGDIIEAIVAIKDSQGNYIYVNKAFLQSLQVEKSHIIGQNDLQLFGAELAKVYMDDDQKIIQGITPNIRTAELVTYRPGLVRWHSTNKSPLLNNEGNIIGVVLISTLLQHRQDLGSTGTMGSISKAIDFIYANPSKNIRIPELTKISGVSTSSLERGFKEHFHCSPAKFITQTKISHACTLLANPIYSIAQVGELSGYPDPVIFSRVFKREMKINPRKYRNSL